MYSPHELPVQCVTDTVLLYPWGPTMHPHAHETYLYIIYTQINYVPIYVVFIQTVDIRSISTCSTPEQYFLKLYPVRTGEPDRYFSLIHAISYHLFTPLRGSRGSIGPVLDFLFSYRENRVNVQLKKKIHPGFSTNSPSFPYPS